jgi:hypothetical protein
MPPRKLKPPSLWPIRTSIVVFASLSLIFSAALALLIYLSTVGTLSYKQAVPLIVSTMTGLFFSSSQLVRLSILWFQVTNYVPSTFEEFIEQMKLVSEFHKGDGGALGLLRQLFEFLVERNNKK